IASTTRLSRPDFSTRSATDSPRSAIQSATDLVSVMSLPSRGEWTHAGGRTPQSRHARHTAHGSSMNGGRGRNDCTRTPSGVPESDWCSPVLARERCRLDRRLPDVLRLVRRAADALIRGKAPERPVAAGQVAVAEPVAHLVEDAVRGWARKTKLVG